MKLYELFLKCDKKNILDKIKEIYPDSNLNLYELTLNEIDKIIQEKKYEFNEDLILVVCDYLDEFEKEDVFYADVSSYSLSEKETYGLSFTEWKEWLGLNISKKSFEVYDNENLLAHILYEMTFNGYTEEDIKIQTDDIISKLNEAKDSNTSNFIPFDEMREKYGLEEYKKSEEDLELLRNKMLKNKERYKEFI